MKKIILQAVSFGFSLSIFSPMIYAEQENLNQLREQAVLQIRQGQVSDGLLHLKQLHENYPKNALILADYLLSLQQTQQFTLEHLVLIEGIDADFPQYAQLAVLRQLRDLKQFQLGLKLAQQFQLHSSSTELTLMVALLAAEAEQPELAKQPLKQLALTQLSTDQLVSAAYAARKSGDLIHALSFASRAYQQNTNHLQAQAEYYYVLSALESSENILKYADKDQLQQKNPDLYHEIKSAYFAQKIRNESNVRDYRLYWSEKNANVALDQTIKDMQAYAAQLDYTRPNYKNFYYDLIYVLSAQNQNEAVLAWVKQLKLEIVDTPMYVRQAIADAYLGNRQPQQAEYWYSSLMHEPKGVNFSAYSGLYYAFIEQEKYKQAGKLLSQLDDKLATLALSEAPGSQPEVHGDRANYINLLGLHEAYSNHLNKAELYYQGLLAIAPNNANYINQLAMVQRWRNKPLQARQTLQLLQGILPVSKSTLLNEMQNAQALGEISLWRNTLTQLQQVDPEDTGVIKAARELADRDRFSLSHNSSYGRSQANGQKIAKSLQGLNDRETSTTLYSPWLQDHYRLFSQYKTQWSEYQQGEIEENRYGLGVEWSKNRMSLSTFVSQNDQGERTGIALKWSQWLNDHWYYQLAVDSASDVPLQALLQGYSGQSYQAGITWQKDESRRIDGSYKFSDLEDGNQRQEMMLSLTQDLWQSPHHQSEIGLSTYYGLNSLDNASYFNPKNHYSAELNFSHDWLTWRSYDRSFNQHIELAAGLYGQDGFSTKPIFSAQYLHEWKLNRDWQLNYGIGWRQHPYDGEQEQRTYGILGFEGRF